MLEIGATIGQVGETEEGRLGDDPAERVADREVGVPEMRRDHRQDAARE